MSDVGYSDLLLKKINYINTFYHQEPRFDITAPLSPKLEGTLDFLISTDVFEHISPPIALGFENALRLLKSTGVFIFTAPFHLEDKTFEHFPELYKYEIVNQNGKAPFLKNMTRDGREQIFENLVFHGGSGSTLEMRIFSKSGLLYELERSGFGSIKFYSEPCWEFGVYWPEQWSLPMTARPAHRA